MPRLVRRTSLTMRAPGDLRPARARPPAGLRVEVRRPCAVDEYRALYRLVGEPWEWRDRLGWPDTRLAAWLARPDVRVHVLETGDDPAPGGYYELHRRASGLVEIVYFGLAPRMIGRGAGGWLLERAVRDAWAMAARAVVLSTCTLDGPAALPNYLARGFTPYRTEEYLVP